MEVDKKKVLVLGCGSIGSKYVNLLINFGFSVDVYDIKKIDNKLFDNKVTFFESIEACIKREPDFVIISTPPNAHFSCLKKVIESKAKILLEKPLAASIADAKNIIEIAKKNKGKVWCVANMRYHPGFQAIERNINNLGKIYSATSHFSHKLSQMRPLSSNTNGFFI